MLLEAKILLHFPSWLHKTWSFGKAGKHVTVALKTLASAHSLSYLACGNIRFENMCTAVQFQSSVNVHSPQRIHSNKPWWALPGNSGFLCGHPSHREDASACQSTPRGKEHPRTKTAQTGLNRLFFHCINACISRSSASKLSSAPQDFSAPSGDPQQLLLLPEPLQNCLLWTPGARLLDHGAAARTLSPSNQDLLEIRSPLWWDCLHARYTESTKRQLKTTLK